MARRFLVGTPEDLRELGRFLKDGDVQRVATAWNVTRRKNGTNIWDGNILVSFRSEGAKRIASVFRMAKEQPIEFATLKYQQALDWCKEHLHGTE